jgi:hypothetical protein
MFPLVLHSAFTVFGYFTTSRPGCAGVGLLLLVLVAGRWVRSGSFRQFRSLSHAAPACCQAFRVAPRMRTSRKSDYGECLVSTLTLSSAQSIIFQTHNPIAAGLVSSVSRTPQTRNTYGYSFHCAGSDRSPIRDFAEIGLQSHQFHQFHRPVLAAGPPSLPHFGSRPTLDVMEREQTHVFWNVL